MINEKKKGNHQNLVNLSKYLFGWFLVVFLIREWAKFIGNGAGQNSSGAETFLITENHGARTFFGKKNHGAHTFSRKKNHGAHTFFQKKITGRTLFLLKKITGCKTFSSDFDCLDNRALTLFFEKKDHGAQTLWEQKNHWRRLFCLQIFLTSPVSAKFCSLAYKFGDQKTFIVAEGGGGRYLWKTSVITFLQF